MVAGSLSLMAAGTSAASAATSSPAGRISVANAQPGLGGATTAGTPDGGQDIDVTVYLKNRDSAALAALVAQVSDPASAQYGRYLTPAAFRSRFGPTRATVEQVSNFLDDSGLSVTAVAAGASFIEARGSVETVQKAFGTTLETYTLNGKTFRAAAAAPSIPSGLGSEVLGVSGLASVSQLMTPDNTAVAGGTAVSEAPPSDAFVNATPCSTYFGEKIATDLPKAYGSKQPYVTCGYQPAQLQDAYGVTRAIAQGLDGKGVTVAITDAYASPTARSDANTYAKAHGQPILKANQYTELLPGSYQYGYDDTVNGDQCGEQ
ncbi:MAG: protease pro-enzyme activation domain-containing protein, partial [Janthinobacterium lividum]